MSERGASKDDGLGDRLEDLFSAVTGPPKAEPRPSAEPVPTPAPPTAPTDLAEGSVVQSLDVAGLVRYLDAQLEQTRREVREQVATAVAAVQALDERLQQVAAGAAGAQRKTGEVGARLEEFAKALFGWVEEFSKWQTKRFDGLDRHLKDLRLPPPAPSGDSGSDPGRVG